MNKSITVSALNAYIKEVFQDETLLHDLTLDGEIAEVSTRKGNTYLTLTDNGSSIDCIHFRSEDFKLKKGDKVGLVGAVRYYDKRASVSFVYNDYTYLGNGSEHEKLLKIIEQFKQEGLFDNKLSLPKYVFKAAVITSEKGAAIEDFIKVLSVKAPAVNIYIVDAAMQGENAADEILNAFNILNGFDCDVVVLCRGGGSDLDLNVFNNEIIARAVSSCNKPVISAVGHEIDFTLCDYCAASRAGTPSIAADMIAQLNNNYIIDLYALTQRASNVVDNNLSYLSYRLDNTSKRFLSAMKSFKTVRDYQVKNAAEKMKNSLLNNKYKRFSTLTSALDGLKRVNANAIERKGVCLNRATAALDAASPLKIMSKGYAKVYRGGREISSVAACEKGDELTVRMADGTITTQITDIKKQSIC